jgi:class 3 adenylate cyclase
LQAIAQALARGETPPAKTYPATTILFSDVVGFTNISGKTNTLRLEGVG